MQTTKIIFFTILIVLMMISHISAGKINEDEPLCACPMNFAPVCGSDNITYPNTCALECKAASRKGRSMGLRMVRKGECDKGL